MYQKNAGGWVKHLDFMIVDFITLQITYILAYLTRHGINRALEVYQEPRYLSSEIGRAHV